MKGREGTRRVRWLRCWRPGDPSGPRETQGRACAWRDAEAHGRRLISAGEASVSPRRRRGLSGRSPVGLGAAEAGVTTDYGLWVSLSRSLGQFGERVAVAGGGDGLRG